MYWVADKLMKRWFRREDGLFIPLARISGFRLSVLEYLGISWGRLGMSWNILGLSWDISARLGNLGESWNACVASIDAMTL
jgi:hypothetical protein